MQDNGRCINQIHKGEQPPFLFTVFRGFRLYTIQKGLYTVTFGKQTSTIAFQTCNFDPKKQQLSFIKYMLFACLICLCLLQRFDCNWTKNKQFR